MSSEQRTSFSQPPGSTSTGLLQRAKAHEPEAWRRMVELYAPLVYRCSRRSGLQAQDAADIVQEVFRSVSATLDRFEHDRPHDSFRAWLRTITINKIRDHFRRQAIRPAAQGGSTAYQRFLQIQQIPDKEEGFTGDCAVSPRALAQIRQRFDEKTWQAFWAMAVEGRRSADVAEDLGMTKKAVRQAKYRVLRCLRQELESWENPDQVP